MTLKQWIVEVDIDEHEGKTRATARLRQAQIGLTGTGLARCNPTDQDVPQIGDELAAARALSDLAHKLIDKTASDIESVTHRPAELFS